MRASLVGRTPETVERVGTQSFVFGSTIPYASYHQRGSPETRLPARPILRGIGTVKQRALVSRRGQMGPERPGSLSWAFSQVAQAYVVQRRRLALGTAVDDVDTESGRRAIITSERRRGKLEAKGLSVAGGDLFRATVERMKAMELRDDT